MSECIEILDTKLGTKHEKLQLVVSKPQNSMHTSEFLPKIGPKDAEDQKPAPFLMFEYGPYHKVVKQVKKDDFANHKNFTAK